MSRVHARLTFVVAVMSWACHDPCFGAGIPCSRVDSNYQRIRFAGEDSFVVSPDDPDGIGQAASKKNTQDPMLAVYSRSTGVSSSGNIASTASNITASCPFAFGATNISVPQVTFDAGTSLGATATDGAAHASFGFGTTDGNTRATGTFQVLGTNQTGTLEGLIDIVIGPFSTSGDGALQSGEWSIQCGGSLLAGSLNANGDGWDVLGGILVDDVYYDMSGPWPLAIDMVIPTSQTAHSGNQFLVEIKVDDVQVTANADAGGPTNSAFVGGFSLSSSFSIQQP